MKKPRRPKPKASAITWPKGKPPRIYADPASVFKQGTKKADWKK